MPSTALQLDTISYLDLPNRVLADYQVVILANVPDLPSRPDQPNDQARRLSDFVKEGGGLIVFLGDNTQPAVYNARFQYQVPILPAEIQAKTTDARGFSVQTIDHPLSRIIGGLPSETQEMARVFRYFKLNPGPGSRTAMQIAGRGDPILVEHSLGRGSVVLFASSPELGWTNMVVEPGFYPILINEALAFVGRSVHEKPFTVSQSLEVPLPVSVKGATDEKGRGADRHQEGDVSAAGGRADDARRFCGQG